MRKYDVSPLHMLLLKGGHHSGPHFENDWVQFGKWGFIMLKALQFTNNLIWVLHEQWHLDVRASDVLADGRWDKQNCVAGVWLLIVPSQLNGTSISEDEWCNNVCLWYNHKPLKMPDWCDECGGRMTVEDDIADEWWHLCGTALSFGWVEHKPRIFSCIGRLLARKAGETVETPPSGERDEMQMTEEQGDTGTHGFWQHGWSNFWCPHHWYRVQIGKRTTRLHQSLSGTEEGEEG